jgi:hypothetical protein
MDLWTSQAGYNQDLGIFVCDSSLLSCSPFSSFSLLAWKESGGFAGTFSPNAAYAEAVLGVTSGHNYVFTLGWKPNIAAPGGVIHGAAGTASTEFSPTSLVVLLAG